MAQSAGRQGSASTAPAVSAAAVLHPYQELTEPGADRRIVGLDSSNRPFGVDFEELMLDGDIGSKNGMIISRKNRGKTSLGKKIVHQNSNAVPGDGRDEIRWWADEVRQKSGVGEWDDMAVEFDSEPIRWNDALNFFDDGFKMGPGEHFTTVINAHEIAADALPSPAVTVCYQTALEIMLRDYAPISSLPTLGVILAQISTNPSLVKRSLQSAFHDVVKAQVAEMTAEQSASYSKLQELANTAPEFGFDDREIRGAASEAMYVLKRLLDGDFNKRVGGFKSYASLISQPGNVFDYTGMSEKTITLVQSFNWRLKEYARLHKLNQFYYDIEVVDEAYRLMRYVTFAESVMDSVKQTRSTNQLKLFMTHRLADFETVGAPNSRQREIATNFVKDMDFWFVGKLAKNDAAAVAELLGLDAVVEESLPSLPSGEFWAIMGDRDPVLVNTFELTSARMRDLAESNQANTQQYMANH
jgi:hypothetical protein